MTQTTKRITKLIVSIGLAAAMGSAWAFPTKPIRVVMGFPAGGPLDQHARLLTDRLEQVMAASSRSGLRLISQANRWLPESPSYRVWSKSKTTSGASSCGVG